MEPVDEAAKETVQESVAQEPDEQPDAPEIQVKKVSGVCAQFLFVKSAKIVGTFLPYLRVKIEQITVGLGGTEGKHSLVKRDALFSGKCHQHTAHDRDSGRFFLIR